MNKQIVLWLLSIASFMFILCVNIKEPPADLIYRLWGWTIWFFLLYSYILIGYLALNLCKKLYVVLAIIDYIMQCTLCYCIHQVYSGKWLLEIQEQRWLLGICILIIALILSALLWLHKDIFQKEIVISQTDVEQVVLNYFDNAKNDEEYDKVKGIVLNNLGIIMILVFMIAGNIFGVYLVDNVWGIYLQFVFSVAFIFINYNKYKKYNIAKRRYILDIFTALIAFYYMGTDVFALTDFYYSDLLLTIYLLTPFLLTFINIYQKTNLKSSDSVGNSEQ